MDQSNTLVTSDHLAAIRSIKEAKSQLTRAIGWARGELGVAIGDVARENGSYSSVVALQDAHMASNILNRLEETVASKNTKPVSREAVGWALDRVDAERNLTKNLRAAIKLEERTYILSEELRGRLADDFENEALAQQARSEGQQVC